MDRPTWMNVGGVENLGEASVSASNDQLTLEGHELASGDLVTLTALSGGAEALVDGVPYYVREADEGTFRLSATRGGVVFSFDDDGSCQVHRAQPRYSAAELRRADTALLLNDTSDRLGARSGIRPGREPVTLSGDVVNVRDTPVVFYPGLTSTAGPYRVGLRAATITLPPADGSQPRRDLVVARLYDDDEDFSGKREAVAEIVEGTPASSPSKPDVPEGAVRLATVDVPADGSGTPSIDASDPPRRTVASGGIVPVATVDDLPTDGLYGGLLAWVESVERVWVLRNDSWEPLSDTMVLDRVDLEGSVGAIGTPVTIPAELRGLFRSYTLEVDGHVSNDDRSLVIRVNSIDEEEYRYALRTASQTGDTISARGADGTGFPRMGDFGGFGSLNVVNIVPRSSGSTGFIQWVAQGWINNGGNNNGITWSAGRWNGAVQQINHFNVRSNFSTDTWASNSRATLRGNR